MLDELEGLVILEPKVLLPGKDLKASSCSRRRSTEEMRSIRGKSSGLKTTAPPANSPRSVGGWSHRAAACFYGWQGPHEHHPIVVGRGYRELPAEKPGKLIYLDVRHAVPSSSVPGPPDPRPYPPPRPEAASGS